MQLQKPAQLAAIIIGVKAAILTSTSNTSIANKPGTAKAAAIPAAPQPMRSVRSL
jgi:hypothetical protein